MPAARRGLRLDQNCFHLHTKQNNLFCQPLILCPKHNNPKTISNCKAANLDLMVGGKSNRRQAQPGLKYSYLYAGSLLQEFSTKAQG